MKRKQDLVLITIIQTRWKHDYSYVDTKAAATGEIIYDLIINYLKEDIDKDIAICLYTIITDTGGFRYTNTTPHTLEVSAELLKYDIDFSYINKRVLIWFPIQSFIL